MRSHRKTAEAAPPTAPVWVFGPATPEDYQTGFYGVTIVEESTDDQVCAG